MGFGLGTIAHLVPFQCSTSVLDRVFESEAPTAKQLLALAHATPFRWLCEVLAPKAATVQTAPFQRCASAESPTAAQYDEVGHDTAVNSRKSPPAGWGTIDQIVPFQCSVTGAPPLEMLTIPPPTVSTSAVPTAEQSTGLEHDTPSSCTENALRGLGLSTIVQTVPSHRSMSALPENDSPTAVQLVADGHEMPNKLGDEPKPRSIPVLAAAWAAPAESGFATTDHLAPSQCSMSAPPEARAS